VAEYLASRQALADQFARLIQDCGNEQTEQFDQLLAATRPGKSYVGTYEASAWGRDSGSGAIRFTFGSQKQDGTSIELTAADAHDLSRTRRFVGVIVDTPGEEKPLRLKPVVDDGVTDDKPCWPPMRKGLNMEIRCAVHGPELVVEWGIMRRESMLKLDSQQ
jgi:hypothetical protein